MRTSWKGSDRRLSLRELIASTTLLAILLGMASGLGRGFDDQLAARAAALGFAVAVIGIGATLAYSFALIAFGRRHASLGAVIGGFLSLPLFGGCLVIVFYYGSNSLFNFVFRDVSL